MLYIKIMYLKTRHQLFHRGKWSRCDVTHGEAIHVDKDDHTGDDKLLVFVTHNLRDHETYSLDVLKLFSFNQRLLIK